MTWPLTPAIPITTEPISIQASTVATNTRAHLGYCITRPLRRDQKNDYAAKGGAELVSAAVVQVLATIADTGITRGEMPWRTEFGSGVELVRYRSIDPTLEDYADVLVFEALQRWEPRCIIRRTQMGEETISGINRVVLRVIYDIASTNTPGSEIIAYDLVAQITIQ